MGPITAKELRERLANVPDDTVIMLPGMDMDKWQHYLPAGGWWHGTLDKEF